MSLDELPAPDEAKRALRALPHPTTSLVLYFEYINGYAQAERGRRIGKRDRRRGAVVPRTRFLAWLKGYGDGVAVRRGVVGVQP